MSLDAVVRKTLTGDRYKKIYEVLCTEKENNLCFFLAVVHSCSLFREFGSGKYREPRDGDPRRGRVSTARTHARDDNDEKRPMTIRALIDVTRA